MLQTRIFTCIHLTFLVLQYMAILVCSADDYSRADFPADFVFGAGVSAYQVEGAAFEDGRTPSIWDTFAHEALYFGGNGDIACDQYHKYKEDVQLMVETGLEAYRFSISWSRLIPNGRGPVNPKGLEYYNNPINELILHGIQPHVTLCHIDTPQALEDEYGGWISRKIVKDFTTYVDVCFKEFGDRVLYWTTLNEPNIIALGGYDNGLTPPGRCSLPFAWICPKGNSSTEPYIAAHNMLLAHSSAVKIYKKKYKVYLSCIYTYNGAAYKASALPSGASLRKCRAFVRKALKINAPCKHKKCTFNGVWGGSGGPGQKNLYVSSFFHDIATEVGILQPNGYSGRARPVDYLAVAKRACMTKYSHIKSAFPNIEERDIPYVCMDLVYQYTLLVDGFGLKPSKKITLVSSVKYRNSLVGAAWPLGSAIDAISSST